MSLILSLMIIACLRRLLHPVSRPRRGTSAARDLYERRLRNGPLD